MYPVAMATLLGRLVGVANSPICTGSPCYGPSSLVMVSPSFHLPRYIPATVLMLLFLLYPASKQSENPVGFTFNEHPEFGRSLPLCGCRCGVSPHRFFLGLLWAPPPWSLASALAPDRWSPHTPSKSGDIPPLPKTLPGLPLPCCQCQDPDDDLGGPSASGLPLPCVRLSDFISKHSRHIPASGPLHLLSACSRTLPRYPCGLVPLQGSAPGLCFLSASIPDLPVWKHPSSPGSVSRFAVAVRSYSLV